MAPPSERDERQISAALVAFGGPNGAAVFPLLAGRTPIGRPSANTKNSAEAQTIEIDEPTVSRRHAVLNGDASGWTIEDLGSENGTRLNGSPVRPGAPARLKDGDRVELGYQSLKFVLDASPQIERQTRLRRVLRAELTRAAKENAALTVMLVNVRGLRKINDQFGMEAGDRVLKVVGAIIDAHVPESLFAGSFGGAHFAVLLRVEKKAAELLAAEMVERIKRQDFVFGDYPVFVEAAVGIYVCRGADLDLPPERVMAAAQTALYEVAAGQRKEQVLAIDEQHTLKVLSPFRDFGDRLLFDRARGDDQVRFVVAFELENERSVVRDLGPAEFEARFTRLTRAVKLVMESGDAFATSRHRYVFLAVGSSKPEERSPRDIEKSVVAQWRELTQAANAGLGELRVASLTQSEVRQLGDDALTAIIGRLPARPTGSSAYDELPFPLAAPIQRVGSLESTLEQAKCLTDATESALQFLVAAFVAWLRQGGERAHLDLLASAFARDAETNERAGLGAWLYWAETLAPTVAQHAPAPLSAVAARLLADQPRARSLFARLKATRDFRNQSLGHPKAYRDAAHYAEAVPRLRSRLEALLAASSELGELEFGVIEGIEGPAEDAPERTRYVFKRFHGAGEFAFRAGLKRDLAGPLLTKGQTFLLGLETGALRLEPLMTVSTCEQCGRLEIFAAEEARFGPRGESVPMIELIMGHRVRRKLPWAPEDQRLFEVLAPQT